MRNIRLAEWRAGSSYTGRHRIPDRHLVQSDEAWWSPVIPKHATGPRIPEVAGNDRAMGAEPAER
jgi:hypothetical protein